MPSSVAAGRSPSPKSATTNSSPPPASQGLQWKGVSGNPEIVVPNLGSHEQARRPSIAFLKSTDNDLPSVKTQQGKRPGGTRRLSSPPPPPVFQQRVSFDTFDTRQPVIEENSFTLVRKHKDYEYTRRSRTFLVGLDENDYSSYALEWLIEELVDDGDEIVALRVVDTESRGRSSLANAGSGQYKKSAEALMDDFQSKNVDNKAVNLILEFAIGKVNKVIADMINLYEPAILIVGTRGRSTLGFQGLLPGSVSKYCLQHSPVPVIVVRPNTKRVKSKRKRAQDPTRHTYQDMVKRSSVFASTGAGGTGAGVGAVGGNDGVSEDSHKRNTFSVSHKGHILDPEHRNEPVDMPADGTNRPEAEAAAVAAAIGVKDASVLSNPFASPAKSPGAVKQERNAAMAALLGEGEGDDEDKEESPAGGQRDESPEQAVLKDDDDENSSDNDDKSDDADSEGVISGDEADDEDSAAKADGKDVDGEK